MPLRPDSPHPDRVPHAPATPNVALLTLLVAVLVAAGCAAGDGADGAAVAVVGATTTVAPSGDQAGQAALTLPGGGTTPETVGAVTGKGDDGTDSGDGAGGGPTGEPPTGDDAATADATGEGGERGALGGSETDEVTVQPSSSSPTPTRPAWLGTRVLTTNADGVAAAQPTPPELLNRAFPTVDTLPPPPSDTFEASVEPLTGDPLARSTWSEECPVEVAELRYLRLTFWGFDGRPHTGEMIVHGTVADDIVGVFRTLHEARFPIEEMRIVTPADIDAPPTGDGNNTTAFVCRAVVGGSRFSEHAYGLAVDINPFQNPYRRGEVVLPELATAYLARDPAQAGVIHEGGVVVEAFDAIGWGWGGRWRSLDDHHHFSLNNR